MAETKKAVAKKPECVVPGCERKPATRGLCNIHWQSRRGLAK